MKNKKKEKFSAQFLAYKIFSNIEILEQINKIKENTEKAKKIMLENEQKNIKNFLKLPIQKQEIVKLIVITWLKDEGFYRDKKRNEWRKYE